MHNYFFSGPAVIMDVLRERQKKRTLVTPIINNESPYYYAKKARIYRTNLNCHNHGDLYCCLATELRLMNHVNHPRLLYV